MEAIQNKIVPYMPSKWATLLFPAPNSAVVSISLPIVLNITDIFSFRETRTAFEQGLYQGLALIITLGISLSSGLLIGKLLNSNLFHQQKKKFDDEEYWELPEEIEII